MKHMAYVGVAEEVVYNLPFTGSPRHHMRRWDIAQVHDADADRLTGRDEFAIFSDEPDGLWRLAKDSLDDQTGPTLVVAIITTRRTNGFQYLRNTVLGVRRSAVKSAKRMRVVVAANDRSEVDEIRGMNLLIDDCIDLGIEPQHPQHRAFQAYRETLRTLSPLLTEKGTIPVLAVLQDDVEFCVHAMDRVYQLARFFAPQTGFCLCSLYTPTAPPGPSPRVVNPYPAKEYTGEVAVLWGIRGVGMEQVFSTDLPHDTATGQFFSGQDWRVFQTYYADPCLVQHVGKVSAIGDVPERRTGRFNPRYDATYDNRPALVLEH